MAGAQINIEVSGLEEVKKLLSDLPDRTFENTKRSFSKSAIELQETMTDRSTSGPLRRRTGGLARSWQPRTSGTDFNSLKSSVASFTAAALGQNPVIYAPIQEFGGTIRSKRRNGFLTIPMPDNLTAAGVAKKSAREVINEGGHFAGGAIISASDELTHVLKRRVVIPARLGFFNEGEKQVVKLMQDLNEHILDGL